MTLRLPDQWIWDFWLARDGLDYHVFHLQAPRALRDEERRHRHASIGHAVSRDLRDWQVLPDALAPGPDGAWDDNAAWTGSVIRHGGLWHLFYTGTHRAEEGLVQRIGLATSSDLTRWEKHPANPIITADPRWYELLDLDAWHDQAWRDPYVFQHPHTGDFHAFITARVREGPADGRGVIGHARSDDLIQWEVLPPLTEPGGFGHLEVPQWLAIRDRYYLLFSASASVHSDRRRERTGLEPVTGTHYFIAEEPLGPFHFLTDTFLVGDPVGTLYSGKLVRDPAGALVFLAWRRCTPDGAFVGELADPLPAAVGANGALSISWNGSEEGG